MAKVSVIIPIFNVEKYLKRCLDSICNQTIKDIEIICINDCSTDNSLQILKQYEEKDSRIKVIDLERNSGAAVARNKGLEIATGEYLGFIDPDDWVDIDFFGELYKIASKKSADIAKGQMIIYPNNSPGKKGILNDEINKFGKYHFGWQWNTAIYKKSFIDKNNILFPERCRKAQDIVFLTQSILHSKTLVVDSDVNYHYRRRENSLDSKYLTVEKIKSQVLARKKCLDIINTSNLYDLDTKNYYYIYCYNLTKLLSRTLYRNYSDITQEFTIRIFVDAFHNCKKTTELEKILKRQGFSLILKYTKERNINKLTKLVKRYNDFNDLYDGQISFWEKIFSIREIFNKTHTIFNILGIRIKIRTNL